MKKLPKVPPKPKHVPADLPHLRDEPLSPANLAFVTAYVDAGGDLAIAAKDAKISVEAAADLILAPRIRAAIEARRDVAIRTEGASRAWKVIENMMTDPAAPAQARFNAAKWVLESAGHGLAAQAANSNKGSRKELHEMTDTELHEFIRQGTKAIDEAKAAAKIVDVSGSPSASQPQSGGEAS